MIRLRVAVRGNGDRLRQLATERTPAARRQMTDSLHSAVLSRVVATTPVRTVRARRGWISAMPDADAGEGSFESSGGAGVSRLASTNHVPYVPFLEYGTSRMAPREIVRRALQSVAALARALFSLSGGQSTGGDDVASDPTSDGGDGLTGEEVRA